MKPLTYIGIALGGLALFTGTKYLIFRNTVNTKKYNHAPNTVDKVSVFPFYTEIYTKSSTKTTEEAKTTFLGIL